MGRYLILFFVVLFAAFPASARQEDELVVDDNDVDDAKEVVVLSQHKVRYSDPPIDTKFRTSSRFNARGMQHVYALTHAFLNLVQRQDVFPPGLNASTLFRQLQEASDGGDDGDPAAAHADLAKEHWAEVLLQYIGVITVAVCALLLAISMPVVCFCVCCCRCAGKCGAYPEHFDKRSDSCKRFSLGVLLAMLVILAMFGVVAAFVNNFFVYEGLQKLPERLQNSADDTGQYLDNTGREINALLVTNFAELEEVLNAILDESGPILKKSLAEVTEAVAIDDLTHIVSNLGTVKRYLRDIQNKTHVLQDKVGQLKLGLNGTQSRLLSALQQCSDNRVCADFLGEYNITRDLAIATDFSDLPTQLPDLSLLMKDISDLMNNDIERKVRGGQKQLDQVKDDIERSIGDIRPKIKSEIRRMGSRLEDQAATIQSYLNEFEASVSTVNSDVPKIKPVLDEYGEYLFYIGLGMWCMVFLILFCHVLGLFYGFCGKRPGNMYGDDCCNTGTGANWLLAATYLTFLFSCVLLIVATAQFLVGSTVDKLACEAMQRPNDSDVFRFVDRKLIQPMFQRQQQQQQRRRPASPAWELVPFSQLIANCHRNETVYDMLQVSNIYDVSELRRWREHYGIGDFILNLKRKVRLDDLRAIQILSPEAERELQELAESQISDLNFSQYTRLLKQQITSINLSQFTSRLRQVRGRLTRQQARLVGPAIDNEALFLDQMQRVVMDMKLAMRDLVNSVEALEKEARHAKPNLREALRGLIRQATKATTFLREEGPQLVDRLTDKYVNETIGLIDNYVERVVEHTHERVGRCEPLSNSYNATVIAVCNQVVDPFNAFWACVGWCLVYFLLAVFLTLPLISLYRKSEPYPGPLVEAVPVNVNSSSGGGGGGGGGGRSARGSGGGGSESGHGKKKQQRRGHRRNPSEYLPDTAHYRAGYSYSRAGVSDNRFQDMAPRNYDNGGAGGAGNTQQPSTSAASASASASAGSGSGSNPPRYSSNPSLNQPPTEYERPPPYYYPGSGAAAASSDVPPPLPAPNRT